MTLWRKDLAETGASPDEAEGFISFARSVEGVEVAALFKELENGEFKVSLRSKNYADVATVAESFGGGGHIRASGFKITGDFNHVSAVTFEKILPLL
jgi:phosphoesterase RecJ-like protein